MSDLRPLATTTMFFWDCECEHDYIHPKTQFSCPLCGYTHDDCPDSETKEVIDQIDIVTIENAVNDLPLLAKCDLSENAIDWNLILAAMKKIP